MHEVFSLWKTLKLVKSKRTASGHLKIKYFRPYKHTFVNFTTGNGISDLETGVWTEVSLGTGIWTKVSLGTGIRTEVSLGTGI